LVSQARRFFPGGFHFCHFLVCSGWASDAGLTQPSAYHLRHSSAAAMFQSNFGFSLKKWFRLSASLDGNRRESQWQGNACGRDKSATVRKGGD
jgi:hypothetical protein